MDVATRPSADPMVDDVQHQLACYASDFSCGVVPAATLHETTVRVIDTLGALVGGFDDEPCRMARALAMDLPVAGGATVVGTPLRTSMDVAAFVNGTTARSAEINDVYHHPGSKNGHPSDVIAPLLAVAEHAQASGRDFLTSVVLAYEIYLRFADTFHNRAFDAANFCSISVAIAAAKLLGLNEAQIAQAISIVVVPNNALNQTRTGHLTMWKSVAAGQAGRAGVFAALLAGKGMRGAQLPFTGRHGWCNHVAGKPFALGIMGGNGIPFKIHDSTIKPRMACLHTLAPILASEKAAAQLQGRTGSVERITVEVYKASERAVAGIEKSGGAVDHHWNPDSRETADHSIPYCVAATLLDGSITPRSFDDAHLNNPILRNLLMKTELVENQDFTAAYEKLPVQYRARVTVRLKGGEAPVGETGGEYGDLSDAKSDEDIAKKFRYFTEPVFGAQRVTTMLDRLWKIGGEKDVSAIPPLFVIG